MDWDDVLRLATELEDAWLERAPARAVACFLEERSLEAGP